jgi:transcriptional regulator with XRE-family HTH domain
MNIRLKQSRIDKGLKLKEVAESVGTTVRSISRYEDGTREPSIALLKQLCDLYDVSADYIIGRTDY